MNPTFTIKNLEVQLRGNLYWVVDKVTGAVATKAFRTRTEADAALAQVKKTK